MEAQLVVGAKKPPAAGRKRGAARSKSAAAREKAAQTGAKARPKNAVAMKVELRKVSELRPYARNPRITDKAVDAVAASIVEFGFRQPIVVDSKGVIVCGHARYKAAKKLGLEKVPVHVAGDLSKTQITAYRIADNKTAELAEWDYDALAAEIAELKDAEVDLGTLGFDAEELGRLVNDALNAPADVEVVPEIFQIVVTCGGQAEQKKLYAELTQRGLKCRVITL